MPCQRNCGCRICMELNFYNSRKPFKSPPVFFDNNFILKRPDEQDDLSDMGEEELQKFQKDQDFNVYPDPDYDSFSDDNIYDLKKPKIKMFVSGFWNNSKNSNKPEMDKFENEVKNAYGSSQWVSNIEVGGPVNEKNNLELTRYCFNDSSWNINIQVNGDDYVDNEGANTRPTSLIDEHKTRKKFERRKSVENLHQYFGNNQSTSDMNKNAWHRRSYQNGKKDATYKWNLKEKFKDISAELKMHYRKSQTDTYDVKDVKECFNETGWVSENEEDRHLYSKEKILRKKWDICEDNLTRNTEAILLSNKQDKHVNRPGGGSREILPAGGYMAYQQSPPGSVGPVDSPLRPTNQQIQPQIGPIRSPNAKSSDEKSFQAVNNKNQNSCVSPRGCPTPNKLRPITPQTPTSGLKPQENSDTTTIEQLVPERDTNSTNNNNTNHETCNGTVQDVGTRYMLNEENSNSRGFRMQHRAALQTVTSKLATVSTNNNRQQNPSNNRTSTPGSINGSTGRNSHLHHHLSVEELRLLQRRQDSNGSSSDECNRSSGHASMSDGHLSSSPPTERHQHYRSHLNSVPEDERLSASVMQNQSRSGRKAAHNRSRHRATPAKLVPCGSGLEDIKLAIQQLTMRSHTSTNAGGYSTSTYSSLSGSESSEPAVRRLMRHSSLETINTNVTSADEFVWVDSHNRLVELQHLPWSNHDVLKVIQNGRTKDHMERVSMETIPRLSYLLQRALVRIGREAQRLARPLGLCSKQEVCSALRITLCPALADSCTKACLRAAAMFAVSGDLQLKQSKSCRAGLQLSVGRFQRWMADVRLGKFVHEYAAVYLAAGMENLLEEIVLQCLPSEADSLLTATMFEHAIANSGDLWGLLQPYAHLNAGRIASGALAMPRWASVSSVNTESTHTSSVTSGKSMEQSLLTTCVGSVHELTELLARINTRPVSWTPSAVQALFYFMRCSQLEHAEHSAPIQELVYERAYVVLPPLVEWLRVSASHAEHRHSSVIDQDDVMQAARLLLPGVDCPVRQIVTGLEDFVVSKRSTDESECVRRYKLELAFKMLRGGRTDLIPHALQLLPTNRKLNSVNEFGLTPLMEAVLLHDEMTAKCLLDAGADPDAETPPYGTQGCPHVHAETQHWTALTYTALQGSCSLARLLIERGAHIEGGARLSEDKCTLTPLQVAVACGNIDMVSLLLSHGAHPFLSTLFKDSLCYSGAAQRGCYSALSVAAAHGQRTLLHKLLSHPLNPNTKEVLSLEEILAEGANQLTADRRQGSRLQVTCSSSGDSGNCSANPSGKDSPQMLKLSKSQIKSLQEAMYHSAENNHLDITLDLRNLGIPWTLHCWMHTLATAHDQRLDNIIDQLLQDFLQVWPDDYSAQFVDECLPLLFNIFRFSKNEGTTLLLADIFSTCYGWEPIKDIRDTSFSGGTRIDPKFVNNPELSDVQFRVEGRVFYGHKIVLVTWSPRFRSMLSSKLCEGNPPVVHINDIRYHIFQLVMQYLYNGGCETLQVEQCDVLELMAAANFFQLDGLLRYCEAQCSSMVDLDNIVSMYIHAKVYNAGELLEYCQGFLLQNMVALLTYDDSVKRLLFGKKLHGHDVLAGLLLTLQARIKARNASSTSRPPKPVK